MNDLHAAIMNLPCKPYDGTDAYTHYCRGHRDARHAAAELVAAASGWIKAADHLPEPGSLIVKRWKSGSVWAGVYRGTDKDSSFDEWVALPAAAGHEPKKQSYTWPPKACPCNSNEKPECQEHGCKWERDPSLVPEALRAYGEPAGMLTDEQIMEAAFPLSLHIDGARLFDRPQLLAFARTLLTRLTRTQSTT